MRRAALLLLLTAPAVAAQTAQDAACARAYAALLADGLVDEALLDITTCDRLAVVLEDAGANRLLASAGAADAAAVAAITPRDVQPLRGATGGAAGSPAQAEAVTSLAVEPFAGGSVSAVGTEAGAGSIATISLNPLVLAGALDDERAVARRARMLDLSVLVPIDDADRDDDGRIDYVGLRARANIAGAAVGDRVFADLRAAYRAAFADVLAAAATAQDQIADLLARTDDPEACARSVLDGTGTACGAAFIAPSPALFDRLDAAAARVREAADAGAFGLDLRLDIGDPTLGLTPGAYGIALTGLVAAGRDLPGTSAAVRGHLGVYYADRDSMDAARFALDGALGVAFARAYGLQQITVEAGLSARLGVGDDETDLAIEDDLVLVSGSVNVPITSTNSASLRVALPLLGEGPGPVVSLSGTWHLPLPGR